MSKRAANDAAEGKIHQCILAAHNQEMTAREVEGLLPDAKVRQKALNYLLAKGLIKALQSSSGLVFRGVSQNELNATKDLTAEEALVYSHIQGSKNEGIWTKQLKAKTNLHQTVIDRCIKTLVQKSMIKRVPSVQHPTRKIYMVEGLEPSIALTGGPWYTDNELDTEFIKLLMNACFRYIQEQSSPKRRSSSHSQQSALYPISNAPEYPTAQTIRTFLKKSRITDTDLSVEHVEMLLNVLVLDGQIEKLPAFGATLWDSNAINDDASSDDQTTIKKRKGTHDPDTEGDSRSSHSKRKRKRSSDSDDKKKRSRSKKRNHDDVDEAENSSRKRRARSGTDTDDSDSENNTKRRRKSSKKKHKKYASSSSESDTASSSDTESDASAVRTKKRRSSKLRQRSSSPNDLDAFAGFTGGTNIYRAVKQEKMALGWSEAPCGDCPSFDFCKDGGPVNPKECVYYGDFLVQAVAPAPTGAEAEDW